MPSKKIHLKFYADECFPIPVVTFLKSQGYSIIHAYDKNLVQKSDRFHLQTSKKLGRVLMTLDRDFNEYEKISLRGFPGVVIISVGTAVPTNITKVCQKVLKIIGEDLIKESLIKVTIDKIIKIKEGRIIFEKKL